MDKKKYIYEIAQYKLYIVILEINNDIMLISNSNPKNKQLNINFKK